MLGFVHTATLAQSTCTHHFVHKSLHTEHKTHTNAHVHVLTHTPNASNQTHCWDRWWWLVAAMVVRSGLGFGEEMRLRPKDVFHFRNHHRGGGWGHGGRGVGGCVSKREEI